MSAQDAPTPVVEKTPEQIRIENIQAARALNEEIITLALKRRGQFDNLLNGYVTDGQGNKYPIDQVAAEGMVAETSEILKAKRLKMDDLQVKIAFKQAPAAEEEQAVSPQ